MELQEPATREKNSLHTDFQRTRSFSQSLCDPLETEDYVVQPVVDVSPPKWHLAHTTWFFEEMILKDLKGYTCYHPDFSFLFNSYYNSVGKRVLRPNRGFMTRPTVSEVLNYRQYVDEAMGAHYDQLDSKQKYLLELGIHHEQQHQELLITDIKYILGNNALFPPYHSKTRPIVERPANWIEVDGGNYEIGYRGSGFSYDNELAVHEQTIRPFTVADKLVTVGDYIEFIEDGGYTHFGHWLSEGWDWVKENQVEAPLYWYKVDGTWHQYTMNGLEPVQLQEPVTHVSYFEADAYCTWKQARLLTEFEWEVFAKQHSQVADDGFSDDGYLHPTCSNGNQLMGYCWEWTKSAYLPYPGFQTAPGAVGEYNGKFMINQMVLRGGSCATSSNHIRTTYRNFFHPHLRWQFTGIRLAQD